MATTIMPAITPQINSCGSRESDHLLSRECERITDGDFHRETPRSIRDKIGHSQL